MTQAPITAGTFSLLVRNESPFFGPVCLFQAPLQEFALPIFSVVWLDHLLFPAPSVTRFAWGEDVGFVAGVGGIVPGAMFRETQYLGVGPGVNAVTLAMPGGTPTLIGPSSTAPQNARVIQADASVPLFGVVAGIGQSGSATLIASALPNFNLVFPAATRLWIATGFWCEAGQVIGDDQIADATEVFFPAGVSALEATYQPWGSWTFAPL
jgi:hypothetical protein